MDKTHIEVLTNLHNALLVGHDPQFSIADLDKVLNPIRTAIVSLFEVCDESLEGKFKALTRCFDLFDQWRNEEDRAFMKALNVNPDLSPAEFSTSRNCLISL